MASIEQDFIEEVAKNIRKVQVLGDEDSYWYLCQSFSSKDGGVIAVLGVDFDAGLRVLDYDGTKPPEEVEAAALGLLRTPSGLHVYVHADTPARGYDEMYEKMCLVRSMYTERLFNADGTPRELPEVLAQDPVMVAHRAAFAMAQEIALDLRINKPGEFLSEALVGAENVSVDRLSLENFL